MFVHEPADALTELPQIRGLHRFIDLAKDLFEFLIDNGHIAIDDRFKDSILCCVKVIKIAQGYIGPLCNITHRRGVKALFNEQLSRGVLDRVHLSTDGGFTEFWHKENERTYF